MRRKLLAKWWAGQLLVVAMAGLILAVGLCMFAQDPLGMDQHLMCRDLCAACLAFFLVVLFLGLAEIDRLPLDRRSPVYAVSLHRLDPPPKLAPIS